MGQGGRLQHLGSKALRTSLCTGYPLWMLWSWELPCVQAEDSSEPPDSSLNYGLPCHLLFYWLAFLLLSLQAIEEEGGNPDDIEVTSEGNKKMPKRPSKGMKPLGHCQCYGCPVGTEPSGSPACLSTVPPVTEDLNE